MVDIDHTFTMKYCFGI